MKKIQIFLVVMLQIVCMNSFARILTVSNDPSGGAQHSSLQAAYDAALDGDTLLLEGTDIGYRLSAGCIRWSKSLVVIGIGFNPQKQSPRKTIITSTCFGAFYISTGGSGSRFYGITFTAAVHVVDGSVNNLSFNDCLFGVDLNCNNNICTNIMITNCIFDYDNQMNLSISGTGTSVLVTNSVFDGWIDGNNSNSLLSVEHSMFLSTGGGGPIYRCLNSVIKNSILVNHTAWVNGSVNCTFLNNIQRQNVVMPPAGHTGSGNLSNTNPNFVNYTLGSSYTSNYDFYLQPGSPAIGFATNGTDCGVHGGSSNFSKAGEPLIVPMIRAVNINNTTVSPNGTLNVQVHATKPKDQ